MFWSPWCSLLRAEGFSWRLDVLYGGLSISKLQFLIKKYLFCQHLIILNFRSSKPLIWIWIRIRNPDPHWPKMLYPDPLHCFFIYSTTLQRHNTENSRQIFPGKELPEKELRAPQSQFPHSCLCERFIYSQDLSAYSAAGKYVDRSWEYINRSQTHESGNWN